MFKEAVYEFGPDLSDWMRISSSLKGLSARFLKIKGSVGDLS